MLRPKITIIGGDIITHDQLLPAIYHMQRLGRINQIHVCTSRRSTVEKLKQAEILQQTFPEQSFESFPNTDDPDQSHPELFRKAITRIPPHNIVVAAVPDQLHYDVILAALRNNQHVCAVKPLVLKHAQAAKIEAEAYTHRLIVGIEYHKRFNDHSLMARRKYREGMFGQFRLGTACLLEK